MIFATILTGCGSKNIIVKEYIYPTVNIPEQPEYYDIKQEKIKNIENDIDYYCLNIDEIKKLLKNITIMKTYNDELKLELIRIKNLGENNEQKNKR